MPYLFKYIVVYQGMAHPKIMGILNCTPDSFFDGGSYMREKEISERIAQMIAERTDIIDLGGESTRPGAQHVSVQDQIQRVEHAAFLLKKAGVPWSIDTADPEVAQYLKRYDFSIINCTFYSEKMVETAARLKKTLVVMHARGDPKTMGSLAQYENVVQEVKSFFYDAVRTCDRYGLGDILLDPGIGFAKDEVQNWALLNNLDEFLSLNKKILVGASRKRFVDGSLEGSLYAHLVAAQKGAYMVRVHDVKEHRVLFEDHFRR